MAKQTFKNLSEERRDAILLIAFEEFAVKGYRNASLSEIIKKVGVAKGSFYRYFDSKRELFTYLLEMGTGRRYVNLDKIISRSDIGFFDLVKMNFKAIIESDKENPVISGFMYRVMHERDTGEISDIIDALYIEVIEKTKTILELPHFREELSISDIDFVAYHIFYSQLWFYDYIAMRYKINYEENIRNHLPVLSLPDDELERIIDYSTNILKHGLLKQTL